MKISEFFNKIFVSSEQDKLEETEDEIETEKESWQKKIQCIPNTEIVEQDLTEEQMRDEQIKKQIYAVLYGEKTLTNKDIVERIEKSYKNVVLKNEEIVSIISIYDAIQYEDSEGNDNLREFIEENENNILELVNKLVENAKEEAKNNNEEDISKFVSKDVKILNELKNEIVQEKKNEETEYEEGRN